MLGKSAAARGRAGVGWESAGKRLVRGETRAAEAPGFPAHPHSPRAPPLTQHAQKGLSAISTTTEGQSTPQVSAALFSHPQTHHTNDKTAAAGQPVYENLFQEPPVPAGRETLD
jgi:hypothetical protein